MSTYLGDVMLERTRIAHSYVRSNALDLSIEARRFKSTHLPDRRICNGSRYLPVSCSIGNNSISSAPRRDRFTAATKTFFSVDVTKAK